MSSCILSVSVCVWVCLDGVWASLDNVFWSSEVISNEKTSMFVTMFSCTIFSQWPHKGPNCQNSENLKSPKVIFFFGARHHVIWSFWSQIDQLITMWTPTHQFQNFQFLPDYHPPLLLGFIIISTILPGNNSSCLKLPLAVNCRL